MSSQSRLSPRRTPRPEGPGLRVVEQMLRDSEQRLQCVIDLSFDWYWEQDEKHRFTLLRHRHSSRPDHDPSEFLGKTPWDLGGAPVHGTWDEHRALRDARLAFADLLVLRRDPHLGERYLSVSGQPIIDAEGRFRGYRGIARDVSAERRHQRLLRLELEISRMLDGDDADTAVTAAIRAICESENWDAGLYWRVDHAYEVMHIHAGWSVEAGRIEEIVQQAHVLACGPGVGLAGAVWQTEEPLWVPDLRSERGLRHRLFPDQTGWNCAFLSPVLSKGQMVGVLEFIASYISKPDDRLSQVISALGCRIGDYHSRALAVARLRESEERYSSTVELAAIGISHVALDGRFIHVNRRLCEMLGYTREELLGLTVRQISHPDDVSATDQDISRLRTGEVESITVEKRYVRKDGTPIWVRLTIASKREPDGQTLHDISIVEDISDRRKAEERVQYLATHDEMTGLPNRAMFTQLLAHAVEQGRRYRRRFAVLFVDLDRFKIVNDSLGHDAGDELLKVMAQRLRESLRSSDIVARLGGDEFVLLVEEMPDRHVAATIARNILSVIIRPVEILGQECRVTASIGISVYPEDAQDGKTLMKNADMAMYQAKEEGKNNYQFYSPDISALTVERLVIETHLRHAMERNELALHYQAKVDFKTGEITGVEALLRWWNQELGSVPPARFIPIAEDCGLIVPIGRWAMRTACAQCATWLGQGLPPVCMAINISPRQFQDPNLLADIAQMIEETGIPPALLEFEITESMIMHDIDRAVENLRAMKGLGVRVAIDDFGTGYSSLSQLKRFPVDTLKVDRSFIRDIPGNTEDRAITEAIISMGKSLGVVVVAEGVETAEQQAFLSGRACDEMQGFYFSRPSPPNEFADLLRSHVPAPRD
jgi:diguanylate cyclase (GGDEF)-like protein/PAS domain S-box-containing protein